MKIGSIEIVPVLDGRIVSRLPATKPLPSPDSEAWRAQHGMFGADGSIDSTFGGFVVRMADRVVLVDAGAGQAFADGYTRPVIDVDDPADQLAAMLRAHGLEGDQLRQVAADFGPLLLEQGGLPTALTAVGVRPEDVTDVVLSHLHFDHIGWVSAAGAPFFPNATIRVAAADLDHFLAGSREDQTTALVYQALTAPERLAPVLDRIETWDADSTLFPGFDVRLAAGHTPGSSVVVLSDGDERAMLLGDMIHCPLELMDDDFDMLVDYDQEAANRVRQAYARELEGSGVPAAAAHFPGLQFGRLLPGEGIRRWTFDLG
jgi:glyoxylase-like metal-dependent hydrolase (beta-lactamase superfamily II)